MSWTDFKNIGDKVSFDFAVIPSYSINNITMNAIAHFAIGTNTKYLSWHIPNNNFFANTCKIAIDNSRSYIEKASRDVQLKSKDGNSETLVFTKQVYILGEGVLSKEEEDNIIEYGIQEGLDVVFKGREFVLDKESVFISYDSRDKDSVVRNLVIALGQRNIPLWYDEYSLKIGQVLRESIENEIRNCKFSIFILSKNFLANTGWTKNEFDSIINKEIIEKKKVILPIWVDVTYEEVYKYSTILAARYASQWSEGVETISNKIANTILSSNNT